MNTITATFKIVTPMFIGGADPKEALEIRPASVKGVLRFWWRALNWDEFAQQPRSDKAAALRKLHRMESRLFGASTSKDDSGNPRGGQGVFLMRVCRQEVEQVDQPFGKMGPHSSYRYLLGLGLARHNDNKTLRPALKEGGKFDVELLFRQDSTGNDQKSVADALYAFGQLGALGSRARHGMGSVALLKWEGLHAPEPIPQNKEAYKTAIQSLIVASASKDAPFSALTQDTRIDISAKDTKVFRLLDTVGKELQLYRSYGRNGMVLGQRAEKNFPTDHKLIWQASQGQGINTAPKRVVFGLPHNYCFSSSTEKAKVNVDYAPKPNGKAGRRASPLDEAGRRASPLLLHIHRISDSEFIAVHLLIKSDFLPTGAHIRIKAGKNECLVQPDVHWSVIRTYLDRFKDKETIYGK